MDTTLNTAGLRTGKTAEKTDFDAAAAPFVCVLTHKADQLATAITENALAEAGLKGLSVRQLHVLWKLDETPDMSQTDLVEATGIDRSTLADVVRRLDKRQLLARKRTKTDARTYAVRLTPKGTEALKAARPVVRKVSKKLRPQLAAILSPILSQP